MGLKSLHKLPILLILLLGSQLAHAAAGTFVLATGDVFVRDSAGSQRRAAIGGGIESNETVLTRDGRAQIRFTDNGLISLQPASEFKIADYRFQDAGGGASQAIFNLIKGGARAITGIIGQVNKPAFRLDTRFATIGIRGTEFTAVLCDSTCKEPDGLYVHTGEGTVFIKNALGEIDVGKGQSGYVPSPNAAPQRTTTTPAVTAKPTGDNAPPPAVPGTQGEFPVGTILSADPLGPLTVLTGAGLALASSGSGSVVIDGVTYSGAGGGSGAGANSNFIASNTNGTGQAGVYLGGNVLRGVLFNGTDNSGNSGFINVSIDSVQNAGADGGLYWGRWSGGNVTVAVGLNNLLAKTSFSLPSTVSIHYVLGTSVPTIPTAGTATYSFIGGTPSTDQTGAVGQGIVSGTLTANFLSNSVGASMTVGHGGNYSLTAVMPFDSNRAGFSSTHVGGSASTSGAGSYAAQVNGFFGGTSAPTAPSRAGVSYTIQAPNPIVGVGAFGCKTGC